MFKIFRKEFSRFELECLDEHNKLRALHGCPPLQLDRALCNYAQQSANQLASQKKAQGHPHKPYGENVFEAYGMAVDGRVPTQHWYDEIRYYRRAIFYSPASHFMQVVWKSSRKLGVAKAKRCDSVYVVAHYDPPMDDNMTNAPQPTESTAAEPPVMHATEK